jgi:hypothetical protein
MYISIIILTLWITIILATKKSTVEAMLTENRKFFFLIVFSVTSYVAWQKLFSIYRYLVALEQLTPLVLISLAGIIFKKQKYAVVVIVSALFFIICTEKRLNWGRLPWDEQYISLTTSAPFDKFENATIVMSGFDPISYIIPFFPPTAKFIRINSNFHNHSQDTKLREMIDKTIFQSNNLKVLITPNNRSFEALEALAAMKIAIDSYSCDRFDSNLGDEFAICDAKVNKWQN